MLLCLRAVFVSLRPSARLLGTADLGVVTSAGVAVDFLGSQVRNSLTVNHTGSAETLGADHIAIIATAGVASIKVAGTTLNHHSSDGAGLRGTRLLGTANLGVVTSAGVAVNFLGSQVRNGLTVNHTRSAETLGADHMSVIATAGVASIKVAGTALNHHSSDGAGLQGTRLLGAADLGVVTGAGVAVDFLGSQVGNGLAVNHTGSAVTLGADQVAVLAPTCVASIKVAGTVLDLHSSDGAGLGGTRLLGTANLGVVTGAGVAVDFLGSQVGNSLTVNHTGSAETLCADHMSVIAAAGVASVEVAGTALNHHSPDGAGLRGTCLLSAANLGVVTGAGVAVDFLGSQVGNSLTVNHTGSAETLGADQVAVLAPTCVASVEVAGTVLDLHSSDGAGLGGTRLLSAANLGVVTGAGVAVDFLGSQVRNSLTVNHTGSAETLGADHIAIIAAAGVASIKVAGTTLNLHSSDGAGLQGTRLLGTANLGVVTGAGVAVNFLGSQVGHELAVNHTWSAVTLGADHIAVLARTCVASIKVAGTVLHLHSSDDARGRWCEAHSSRVVGKAEAVPKEAKVHTLGKLVAASVPSAEAVRWQRVCACGCRLHVADSPCLCCFALRVRCACTLCSRNTQSKNKRAHCGGVVFSLMK